jgi:hypothetical protein
VTVTDKERLRDMRNAIDAMEIAMMGWPELLDLPDLWGEPRHRPDLGVKVAATTEQIYRVCDALDELTRIINSPEYTLSAIKG